MAQRRIGQLTLREEMKKRAMRINRQPASQHAEIRSEVQRRIAQADEGKIAPFDDRDVQEIEDELSAELNENGTPSR